MNVDNENIEPVTDLGLALGYSNQCIQRRLNNDSGAGANAGSGINMTFVANNPLSELVWSPHKGLSLKCADSSFADIQKPHFSGGAGPSNVALLPAQSIIGRTTTTQKNIDEENSPKANTLFQMKSEVAGKDTLTRSSGSDAGVMPVPSHECETGTCGDAEEIIAAARVSALFIDHQEELGENNGDEISDRVKSQMAKITETRENHFSTSTGQVNHKRNDISSLKSDQPELDEAQRNIESSNHTLQIDFILTSEAQRANESQARGDPAANQIFRGRKCLEKMESTSENDLQSLKHEYVCGATNEIVALESSPQVKGSFQQNDEMASASKTVPHQHSPTNSRVHMNRRKGKEKALSDGDVNAMMSKDEDGSHESVESCNSAGLFSTGKRRRSFEEDLVVRSKGIGYHCAQGSTSFTRQDSSFMNWISNMMKGFPKSKQDDAPFPLDSTYHDDGQEKPDKKHMTINKNQDPVSKFFGFQSIFQSLYCAKAEVQETRMLNIEYQVGEGSKEFESSNTMRDMNATPIACHGENSNLVRPVLLLNDRCNESTSGNEEDSAIRPKMLLEKFSGSQEKCSTNSEDNNNRSHLALSKEKERTSSNSSLGKRKTYSSEKANSPDQTSAAKTTSKFCHINDPLGSIWVTRFAPKALISPSNMDHLNHSAGVSSKHSSECLKLVRHAPNHRSFHVDSKFSEAKDQSSEDPLLAHGKELENTATNIKIHNHQKPMSNLNPILPSTKLKPSDAMASVFARRLDALRHITSSRGASDSTDATVTCFFCGIKGHHLRDCSEIKEIELEELLRNVNTYSGIEDLSCLCVRCFQRSHWAVACPKACSTERLQVESNASFREMQLDSGHKENLNFQTGEDTQFQAAVARTYRGGRDQLRTETGYTWKVDGIMNLKKGRSCKKYISTSSGENMLKENQIIPFSNVVSKLNSDVPKALFDAVRVLRLSRTNLLKWMNSHDSLSHIDGFFLRLRLGKWEEGLGGTGYHVACIVGTQKENKPQDKKSSILVDVGGFRCLVESQYVSNHDFLEDELMAWWSTTARNGGKIPSEEDLKAKVKTKRMLGF
ncbi:Zinc finger, CCHC-type domain containing protein [Parasponia andersonii]|uniref:Zinc finger, CCHC-type domain containing protein n=1 Tax=Parasponia andersonii TaxID=3476 RepID=A0A2P5BWR1_PARAD|nr:Zinc finger, CCHC-type domain containing protein [Parasponia andersonii]